jgi:uncharacterized protein (TIGR02246 family)
VDGNAADVETITQVIADVEAGFNGKDVDLLTSHLTQDATVIDVSGRRQRRRNDIEIDARCKLATVLRDQFARYRVNEIAFLRPDIAIATVDVRATTQDGQPKDHAGRLRARARAIALGGRCTAGHARAGLSSGRPGRWIGWKSSAGRHVEHPPHRVRDRVVVMRDPWDDHGRTHTRAA